MASSSTFKVYSFDVFLSFRGEDTRNNFTDHLYDGLKRAGILTFRDNEGINKGEELQPEIERAIQASRASIVVLSQNYATSTWCLDELLLILEQKHFVLPVFHHVDPSDVRNQKGNFTIEVKPGSKWTYDKVCLWKNALTAVANLSGITVSDSSPETIILKEIVNTVYNKLDRKEVHLPSNMTGMKARYKEIESWFNEFNREFLAINGMGGSGKTTLAKYIFNKHRRTFDYVSFVEDIGTRCKGPNDLLQLQEQLLKDISGGKKRKVPGISRGTFMIKDVLQMNKTLIVLDDILEHSQLVALLGTGKINTQSKIIITTRENTDDWFKLPPLRCRKYVMRLLNDGESLELLSHHAFGSKFPNDSYMVLLQEAVRLCEGNPLALEVLGSSLLKNDAIPYWESLLSLFGKDIDSRIQGVLERSYMSLPSDTMKQLFLHIACFFIDLDMDYVVKILEPDYSATFGIKTLIDRCLLFVSPNKKLMMHRLLQEMGKNIVRRESAYQPEKRSRVWNKESYKILSKGEGSKTVQGLALDMKMLQKEDFAFTPSELNTELKTDALKSMDNLKLLQLNFVELDGSYENFSQDLRWLCWLGFHLRTIPANLCMRNLVAIDMSYSNLEVFELPMVIHSLKILNLKDSCILTEILNIFNIPNLETLILWNCHNLVNVCKSIAGLKNLELLNMAGCKKLFRSVNPLAASTSGGDVTEQPTFSFPFSLNRLFLKDCHLICTDSFPLSFRVQPVLQYLNLANSLFETLPCYTHLENLRVLNLSFCSRLTCLERLPNTLAELFVYDCELLERITFEKPRFTLQEFGYEGCINLYEVEGFIKLVPIAKLDETDLGHMKWLKAYQNLEVCLAGDDELTLGRSRHIQMLYEFNIMSISLPDINDPNMAPEYTSKLSYLSFDVPPCPENKRLKGINVTFKYAISGNDCSWFCKIITTNGVDLVYNPRVFGKPEIGKECIWLSYWPIGNELNDGDKIHVSIVMLSGLKIHECGVRMVYSDEEILEDNMRWEEIIGGDLSGFQLSTGVYYLCRHDFFELMEVGRLTRNWFRILVGDTIDYTEIRGWRKTGRPKQVNPSFTELKTIRCIIDGPQLEDFYNIAEMSKSYGDKSVALTTSLLEGEMKSGTKSGDIVKETYDKQELKSGDFISTFDDLTIEERFQIYLSPPLPTQPYATSFSYYNYAPPPPPPPPAPSTYDRVPSIGQMPSVNGRKRAVICGISYRRTKHELKGCINDAKCMKYLLINKFKFPESSILMLTEEETDRYRIPTKHNIRMAMYWLVKDCQPGDSLVFHFSGHGSRQRNYTGDEIDGYDETLCPLDFETQGMIVDDEINATIVKPIPHGVKLHAIIDAYHSGTMLDLPFLCRMDRNGRYVWEDHSPQSGAFKGANGGEVISFSGCDDDQSSVDTSALLKVTSTGAMTFSFIQAIERGHATTYGDMLTSMRTSKSKDESDVGGGAVTPLLGMLLTGGSLGGGIRQEPQLTASEPFDVYTKQFSL